MLAWIDVDIEDERAAYELCQEFVEKNSIKFPEFISNDFLLNIEVDSNLDFIDFFHYVKEKLLLLEKNQGYLKDIFYRYPEINGKQQCPIVVVFDENKKISH